MLTRPGLTCGNFAVRLACSRLSISGNDIEKVDGRPAGSVMSGIPDPARCPPTFSIVSTDHESLKQAIVRLQRFSKYHDFACGTEKLAWHYILKWKHLHLLREIPFKVDSSGTHILIFRLNVKQIADVHSDQPI